MDILELISEIEDEKLIEFVQKRIKFLEEDEFRNIPDTIGYKLDYNPSSFNLSNFDIEETKTMLI